MISEEEGAFYRTIRKSIEEHPEWTGTAMEAIQNGVSDRLYRERHQRIEWETIAMNAMETRLFKDNKGWLASKIEALKDTASFRWDHIIERMKK